MDTLGHHLLLEYWGCAQALLNDRDMIESLMVRAALAAHATIVSSVFHEFSPHGVSGVLVVEESHLSIHTWPEHGYAAVDFYTCGDANPERAHDVLIEGLGAMRSEMIAIRRGLPSGLQIQTPQE